MVFVCGRWRGNENGFGEHHVHAFIAVDEFKESARSVHGKIQSRAGHEVLVIEIPAHNPRRSAVEAARAFWWRIAHAAEKRMQRNFDAWSKLCDHALRIQRNNFYFRIR